MAQPVPRLGAGEIIRRAGGCRAAMAGGALHCYLEQALYWGYSSSLGLATIMPKGAVIILPPVLTCTNSYTKPAFSGVTWNVRGDCPPTFFATRLLCRTVRKSS